MKKNTVCAFIITIGLIFNTSLSYADEDVVAETEFGEGATTSQATPSVVRISAFADNMTIGSMQISPDGKSVVYTMRNGDSNYLVVGDLLNNSLEVSQVLMRDVDNYATNPHWATNNRIIFTLNFKTKVSGTRYKVNSRLMYATDRDGSNAIALRTDGKSAGRSLRHIDSSDLIHILPEDPDRILIGKSRNRDWLQDYEKGVVSDVYYMNIQTGEMEIYMRSPRFDGVKLHSWHSDKDGHIRFGFGTDRKDDMVMLIRGQGEDDWTQLSKNELFEEGKFFPLRFGSQPNEFYVLSSMATGRNTVFKFDIATGELDGKVYGHDTVDVSSLVYSNNKEKVLAAVYYDEEREMVFFDDEYERMIKLLENALDMDIFIHSQSKDEKNLIILARNDTDPGSYYHYDVENKKLNYLASNMEGIYPDEIAQTTPMQYETRDGITISGYITTPLNYSGEPLPTIVLPHSNTRSRDYLSWNYTVKYLANRGYVVIQPNYRGSTGYGHRFMSLGDGEWGGDMQNDLADVARWAVDEGFAHPEKICIMGKSYAGYAALMGVATDADLFKCAISWGGVSDIKRMLKNNESYSTGNRFYQRVAGDAEKSEIKNISPMNYVDNITGAVLLVHGEDDNYFEIEQSEKFAKKLDRAGKVFDYFEMEDAGHYLNTSERRQEFLEIVENFLTEFNPTDTLLQLQEDGKLPERKEMTRSNR